MAALDCEEIVKQALGRNMTDDEIEEFFEQGKRLYDNLQNQREAAGLQDQAQSVADAWAKRKELAVLAKKRNIYLQRIKRLEAVNYAMSKFKGMEGEGLSALMVGSVYDREGARLSVDARGTALKGVYIGGLTSDLESLSKAHFHMLAKGDDTAHREIVRALWSIDNPNSKPYQGSAMAMEIAQVLHKWQERSRADLNRAGGWIGKEPGYIVKQSHDADKIRNAGYEQWKKDIQDRLDWNSTADGQFWANADKRENFLRSVFERLVTGVTYATMAANPLVREGQVGSAAKAVSHERLLRFKSADAWFEYNKAYGIGRLNDAVARQLDRSARTVALMDVFGPSPQANLAAMIGDLRRRLRRKGAVDAPISAVMVKKLERQMMVVDGTADMPVSQMGAAVARNVRALETVARLGGALLSSFSDLPVGASEMKFQGHSLLGSLMQGITGLLQGRGSVAQRQVLSQLGVFFDGVLGEMAARFGGQDVPGKMTALQTAFFKLNFLTWWTDSMKRIYGLMMSHELAQITKTGWDGIGEDMRRVLGLYKIDSGKWDLLRAYGKTVLADGREYLTPEAVFDIPDDAVRAYLQGQGRKKVSQGRIGLFKEELANELRAYFRDRIQYAVLEPDAKTKAVWTRGTQPGEIKGEVLRFAAQFKSFPTVFLQRTFLREIHGRGTDKFWRGLAEGLVPFLKNQHGEAGHVASLIALMTVFGYVSMTIKQLAANKTPRDPRDYKTWLAAFAQGGGAGIYGDFLFGHNNRMGGGMIDTLAGPAMGDMAALGQMWLDFRDGDFKKADMVRFIFSHIPGNNLFYIKAALDAFVLWQLYELINPGYIRRMKRRVKKQNNQTFLIEPRRMW